MVKLLSGLPALPPLPGPMPDGDDSKKKTKKRAPTKRPAGRVAKQAKTIRDDDDDSKSVGSVQEVGNKGIDGTDGNDINNNGGGGVDDVASTIDGINDGGASQAGDDSSACDQGYVGFHKLTPPTHPSEMTWWSMKEIVLFQNCPPIQPEPPRNCFISNCSPIQPETPPPKKKRSMHNFYFSWMPQEKWRSFEIDAKVEPLIRHGPVIPRLFRTTSMH